MDVIKSGGEWISSVNLENELVNHDVGEAAVIGMSHPRWHELPLACIVVREGAPSDPYELRDFLSDRVSKIWLPDAFVIVDEIPRTGPVKFDKRVLRSRLEEGELELHDVAGDVGTE